MQAAESPTRLKFAARDAPSPGGELVPWFQRVWPSYQRWHKLGGDNPGPENGRAALAKYMPELLPTYHEFCYQLAADDQIAAFLTLYNPPTFRAGCSQLVWRKNPLTLLRNYDFPAHLCDRQLLRSNWNGTTVVAMSDCLWGALDGINEHGLAVSLSYGGREKQGEGFAITLVLRYILEFCRTVTEAVDVLHGVPVNMPYNLTCVDISGTCKTVAICPGETPEVMDLPFATNHQKRGGSSIFDLQADSCLRESVLATRSADPAMTLDNLAEQFLQPPLMRKASDWRGWGTLYTAIYSLDERAVILCWPNNQRLYQSTSDFQALTFEVSSPGFC